MIGLGVEERKKGKSSKLLLLSRCATGHVVRLIHDWIGLTHWRLPLPVPSRTFRVPGGYTRIPPIFITPTNQPQGPATLPPFDYQSITVSKIRRGHQEFKLEMKEISQSTNHMRPPGFD